LNLLKDIQTPQQVDTTIKEYIEDFECSALRESMRHGEAYYRNKNTEIMERKMLIYTEDEDSGAPIEMEDPYKANNKLPSGFLKILVDQKVNYSLGNPITVESNNTDLFDLVVGKRFETNLKQIAKEASKKAIGWAHVYIDEAGAFKIMKVPSEQVIPVYNTYNDEKLEMVIRYYSVQTQDAQGKKVMVNRVEVWDETTVTYYQESTETGTYYLLSEEDMHNIFNIVYTNPKYHFEKKIAYGSTTQREGVSWSMIPFIPLYNNDEELTDLNPVKNYIDVYDIVESDFANNFEDFQDMYWILKGYNGESVAQFLSQVKRYKTLNVSDEGDARAEKIDVPYQARMAELDNLETKIYNFGMGFNPNQLGDGNITNVVIKSRFANLDLKASQFEQEVHDFIEKLIEFVNFYVEMSGLGQPVELEDVVFNRSILVNESELLDSNSKQKGVISEETRLSNHPWVDNVEDEMERMEEEKEANLENIQDLNLGPQEEGEGDEPGQEV